MKQREQDSDRYSGREDDPRSRASCDSRAIVVRYRYTFPVKYTALEPEESCCPECGGELDYLGKSALNSLNW